MADHSEGRESERGDVRSDLKRAPIPYRVLVAAAAFGILCLLVIGAFISGRATEVKMDGFTKIQFKIFEQSRQQALQDSAKDVARSVISPDIPKELADRIKRGGRQLVGASVLWVDDGGALQNAWERRALSSLGVAIDTAATTKEALDLLQSGLSYDVIITDLARDNGDAAAACYPGQSRYVTAGCQFIQSAKQLCGDRLAPVIVYAANIDEASGVPAYVLGMTNRFDRLTALVLDALERRPDRETQPLRNEALCARSPISKTLATNTR
jgi:CheY-like chemotaxis protein